MRTFVWGSAIALGLAVSAFALKADLSASARQKSTNDGIYSKAQADAAKP